ncbi:hydroxyproline-rich glycoprotein family protein [Tasmannia lanceolata]|uniref:hydroxyproline-rich glycoprotein family protein n=1 Tax=Tasmannia lanceolata TaxID=3420 RepID=UPI004062C64D
MRNRSSKHCKETEKLKLKEEPHLSGAYIRSLVKQLTSSRTKEPMNPKASDGQDGDGSPQNLANFSETQTQPQPQPPQPKKQVRRRLHTSRPYQERLLNMAEARREIVTALKFHRAAMKQANEQQQQKQANPQPPTSLDPNESIKPRKNPRIYPSNITFSNYHNNPHFSSFSPPPRSFSWPSPPISPKPITETLNLTLPNQPLGLNLNFHDFTDINTDFYHNNSESPSIHSASSSSSPTLSLTEIPSAANGALHQAMDDVEMAEIRSLGQQHEMEWNDTLNLVTSAWWFKFLKTMEFSPERNKEMGNDDGFHLFDEVMDIPAWLNDGVVGNANESCFLQQHLDESYSEWLQDANLPCLDIGEIEGMDGEWLA